MSDSVRQSDRRMLNVLLVEDEAIIALAEAQELSQRGYSVSVCHDGETAVRLAVDDVSIDVVLMDIDLGNAMSGTEAAGRILSLRDMPLIFLSSHNEAAIVEKTENIGSYGYVTKEAGATVLDASIKMAHRLYSTKSKLRESEKAVSHERERLSLLLDHLPVLVAHISADERYLYVNRHFAELYGRSPDALIGKRGPEIIGSKVRSEAEAYFQRVMSGDVVSYEQTRLNAHGEERVLLVTYVPEFENGRVVGFYSLGVDITDRELSERQVLESSRQLEATLTSIADGVMATDRVGRLTRLNPVAQQLTGWTAEEAIGKHASEVFTIINSLTREPAENPIERVLAEGIVVGLANHTVLVARNGTEHQIADSGAPILTATGEVAGSVIVFRDVTDEYRTQERLRATSERLATLFEGISEGIAIHELLYDGHGQPLNYRIVGCNRMFEEILGVSRADTVDRLATDAYDVPEAPYLGEYASVVRERTSRSFTTYFPRLARHFSITCTPWGKQGFATIFSDVTDRVEAVTARNALFNTTGIVRLLLDPRTTEVVDCNPAATGFYGYPREKLVGMKLAELTGIANSASGREPPHLFAADAGHEKQTHMLASGERRLVDVYTERIELSGRYLALAVVFARE